MAVVIHLLHSDAELQAFDGKWTKPTQRSATASDSRSQLTVLRRRFREIIKYITKLFPRTADADKMPPRTQNQVPCPDIILVVSFCVNVQRLLFFSRRKRLLYDTFRVTGRRLLNNRSKVKAFAIHVDDFWSS